MGIYVEEGHGKCDSCGYWYNLNEITLSKRGLVFHLCQDCSETLSLMLKPDEDDEEF